MEYSLDISNFLEEISSLSNSIVFLCFFALTLRKAFLSLLAIIWNSEFKCVYLSFSPLPFASLLFSAICKASSDNHFAFLHLFFLGMILITASFQCHESLSMVLQDVQAGFRNSRGTRDQIANNSWIIIKAREFRKNIYFFYIDYAKAFDCVDHNKLWKILPEMGISDHLTSLLRNLYTGQQATVRNRHRKRDWQIGKGVWQVYILSSCLFNLYAEYIMRNTGLDEAQLE